jgi:hypothetical protein
MDSSKAPSEAQTTRVKSANAQRVVPLPFFKSGLTSTGGQFGGLQAQQPRGQHQGSCGTSTESRRRSS